MNLQQAKELLGINQDDEREIKRKYHNPRKQRQQNQGTQKPNMGNQNVQNQWSADLNESAFTARNIYMHYSMDLSQEEKAVSSENLFYQVTHGKFPICLRVWPIPISAAVSI